MRNVALVFLLLCVQAMGQSITITSPKSGDQWTLGKSYQITWTADGVDSDLNVSFGAGRDEYVGLAGAKAAWGALEVTIPPELKLGGGYQVKVAVTNGPSASVDGIALVENPEPTLTIRAPVGGETWAVATTHAVTWDSSRLEGELRVALFQGEALVDTVAGVPAAAGIYHYTLPDSAGVGDGYRVRLDSAAVP